MTRKINSSAGRDINSSAGRDINSSAGRDIDDLKKTIAALLNDNGCSEAEAKSRQARAAKMMLNLSLTEDEVRAKDPDMFQSDTQITRFDWIVSQFIMSPIEDLTGTQCWYNVLPTPAGKRSDRKLIHFAGYRSDVDQATWLFSHILEQAKAGARGISESAQNRGSTQERNSYLVGFAAAVSSKVRDLIASMDTVRSEQSSLDGSSVDLVLLEKAQVVAAFLETIAPGLVSDQTKGTSVKNGVAAQAGARDGKAVSLGRGVSQAHQAQTGVKALTSA